ncbi:hypothetical protein E2562_017671 [Oryza meyeriana var. granulata]|uniref:FBD domain-containing protein n=1 Tax=Oryza meyeriana var. granulata TaxID=110450 RepID=A0A6G1BYB5_9ORYZ|nr:hypothetical protein E2562_017671 [Oryza meyeriana var. granulata]
MRGLADSITGFLDADERGKDREGRVLARRRVRRLGVEFFATQDTRRVECVRRLITTAVGTWGVEELEVAVKPAPWRRRKVPYFFHAPQGLRGDGDARPPSRRLTKLTLRNCPPAASLRLLGALTTLVLHDLPESTQAFVYDRLFTSGFLHLKKLHLKNCHCMGLALVVDAPPSSTVTELVVDRCSFLYIDLRNATSLEDLACIDNEKPLLILFKNVPCLRRVHLSFSANSGAYVADAQYPLLPYRYNLDWLLHSDRISSLVARFTGPERWVLPAQVSTRLRNLRRLLIADVPSTWDISWPRLLLQAAPSLETLHVHIAQARRPAEEEHAAADQPPGRREIIWPPATFRHRKLGELVVAGFGRTLGQVRFVRYVVKACKALRRVELLRHGEVRYDGLWEWEVARQQGGERHWSKQVELVIKKQILCGRNWFREDVEVVLG